MFLFSLDSGVKLTSPEFYKDISEERLNELLMGDNGIPIPLLKERLTCLHEVQLLVKINFVYVYRILT